MLYRHQRQLRESEEKHRVLFEDSPDSYLILVDGIIVDCNKATEMMLRGKRKQIIGQSPIFFSPVLQPDGQKSADATSRIFSVALQKGHHVFEWLYRRLDGSEFWAEVSISATMLKRPALFATWRDITERKQAEATLRIEKQNLKAIFASAPVGMLLLDQETMIVDANSTAARIVSRDLRQIIHQRSGDGLGCVHSFENPKGCGFAKACPECALRCCVMGVLATGTSVHGAEIQPTLLIDGREQRPWLSVNAEPVLLKGRKHVIIAIDDITKLKQSQEALRTSRLQLAQAMDLAHLVNWEYDVATDLYTFDDRFYALHGTTAEREGGSRMSSAAYAREFVHPEDEHVVTEEIGKALRTTDARFQAQLEHRIVRRDGEIRHIVVRYTIIRDDKGQIVRLFGVNQDITERKRAEAIERERMALKTTVSDMGRVLGVVGHELRTPLAGIRAMSEFVLEDGGIGDGQSQLFLQSIHDEVCRMSDTVDNLLEAARINSGKVRWNWSAVSVAAVCNDAVGIVQPLIDSTQICLSCTAADDLRMQGDADAVRRLVLNLVNNSRKHTQRGAISVEASGDDQWVELVVRDTGSGIAPEIAERLGEPFALNCGVVDANCIDGAGLGLAICKGIVAAHGGTMKIDSVVGRGTHVSVRLRRNLDQPMLGSCDVENSERAWI